MRYQVEMQQDEHRPENNAKAVDNYLWDEDNLTWVRARGKSDGTPADSLPTAGNNPSTALGYTGSNLTTITETIGGTQYQTTLEYDGDNNLISISSAVEI